MYSLKKLEDSTVCTKIDRHYTEQPAQKRKLQRLIKKRLIQERNTLVSSNHKIKHMLKRLRIRLIREFIELNEKLIFNKRLIKFYKSRFNNNINLVIDVGANTGQSIDLFQKLNPNCKIIAFEPNPILFKRLKLKYLNNLNVQLSQLGISEMVGEKIFHENIFHSTSTFEDLNLTSKYLKIKSKILGVNPNEIIKKSYPVKVTTLSNFIENHCKESIDILKIDTEGHEYSCLIGLFNNEQLNDIKYIQFEMHNDDMYLNTKSFKDISELLSKNGFNVDAKIKHGFGDFYELIYRNNSNNS